jgi:serine/threonine-protein kinase HipA
VILLDVWLQPPRGDPLRVGELAFGDADAQGRYEGEFRYVDEWLRNDRAFPIDPESLKLGSTTYRSANLRPPLAVFEDALPDEWGRKLLVAAARLARGQHSEPFLLRALGSDGLGALRFAEMGTPGAQRQPGSVIELELLIDTAIRFEAGETVEEAALRRLLEAGSSPGGARPKALVDEGEERWIAKFPSRYRDGRFDVVGLEATAMQLAAAAQLRVPETKLIAFGSRKALLVRRFDVTPEQGRRHMISLKTLCREMPGVYALTYSEIAERIRKHSVAPRADVEQFFRLMVFNAAIGNTDDHLKNFWMLRDERGYRLAPAFDLVPDVGDRREHVLSFLDDQLAPTGEALAELARRWGVARAQRIIGEVCDAVRQFPLAAARAGVPPTNIAEIGADIGRRVSKLAGPGMQADPSTGLEPSSGP